MTQHEKILTIMLRNPSKVWWLPQDFMQSSLGDLFVGYEASARMSELAFLYPMLIESKSEGRQIRRRIAYQNIERIKWDLPENIRIIIDREYVKPKENTLFN